MILKGYLFSVLYAIICISIAMVAGKLGAAKRYTRKIVHILVGFEWVILTHYMGGGSIHFLAVCLLFTLLLYVDYKVKLVPVMSSERDNAPGTVYYAVAMSIMATLTFFFPEMNLAFGVGVFCTSFGDGLAAVVGQSIRRYNPKLLGGKSLFGTLANFSVCFLTPFVLSKIYGIELSLLHCFLIAVLATELELFTGFGLDNIVITVGVSLFTHFLSVSPLTLNYLAPILVTPLIIILSLKKKALTFGGIIGAIILDAAISVSLGNFGFTVLMAFFVGAVAVDKIKKRIKKKLCKNDNDIEKKGDCRDHVQVAANGLCSGVLALLYLFTSERIFIIGFVASLAEAFADTVASGIGSLSSKVYDPFRMRKCEVGESGGMSLPGTTASLIGSFAIAFLALAFGEISLIEALLISLASFVGGLFDSLLGSLVQVKYKCAVCGRIVEKESHCAKPCEKFRGVRFINNDTVNLLSTFFSAALAMMIFLIVV